QAAPPTPDPSPPLAEPVLGLAEGQTRGLAGEGNAEAFLFRPVVRLQIILDRGRVGVADRGAERLESLPTACGAWPDCHRAGGNCSGAPIVPCRPLDASVEWAQRRKSL